MEMDRVLRNAFRWRSAKRGRWQRRNALGLLLIPTLLLAPALGYFYGRGDAEVGEVCSSADQLLASGRVDQARTQIDSILTEESISFDALLGTEEDPKDGHCVSELVVRVVDFECQQATALLSVSQDEKAADLFTAVVANPASYRVAPGVTVRPVECATAGLDTIAEKSSTTTTTTTASSAVTGEFAAESGLTVEMSVDLTSESDWTFDCERTNVDVRARVDDHEPVTGRASRERGHVVCDRERMTVRVEQQDSLASGAPSTTSIGSSTTTATASSTTSATQPEPMVDPADYREGSAAGLHRALTNVPSRIDRGFEESAQPLLGEVDIDQWLWALILLPVLYGILRLMRSYRSSFDVGIVEVGEFDEAEKAGKGSGALAAATVHDGLRLLEMTSSTGPMLWTDRSPSHVADAVSILTQTSSEQGKLAAAVIGAVSWRPKIVVKGTILAQGLTTRTTGGGREIDEVDHYHNRSAPGLSDSVSPNAAYVSGALAWAAEAKMLRTRRRWSPKRHQTRFKDADSAGRYAIARLGLERS